MFILSWTQLFMFLLVIRDIELIANAVSWIVLFMILDTLFHLALGERHGWWIDPFDLFVFFPGSILIMTVIGFGSTSRHPVLWDRTAFKNKAPTTPPPE